MPFVIQWTTHCAGPENLLTLNTPAGDLLVTMSNNTITRADWLISPTDASTALAPTANHPLQQLLSSYWQNPHTIFTITLLEQGSSYRRKVWQQLSATALGETLSYAALASQIGSAARPVGNACRDNPYPLFIPCHRVVAAHGPGGYCGQTTGALMAIKARLLAYEASFNLAISSKA